MLDVIEDIRNGFKVKLTDKFEEEMILILKNGGNIYIGVNDKGDIIGIIGNIDLLQRTIKDRIKDNKNYIKLIIARGNERPYYLKGMGMTPDSRFIRVGKILYNLCQVK